jgi:hypothetical protein
LRFVTLLGGKYVTVTKDNRDVSVNTDSDFINTLTRTSLNPRRDIRYGFVCSDARLQIMDAIYKSGKANCITIVYEENDKNIYIYIINERGNLFTLVKNKASKDDAIIYLYHLCKNVINRINNYDGLPQINYKIQILRLLVNRFGEYAFEDQTQWAEEVYLLKFKKKKTLSARISKYKSTEVLYNIAVHGEATSLYMPLKRVPAYVEKMTQSDPMISAFISDIAFIDLKKNDLLSGSTLYLLEKFRVEFLIDKTHK